MKIRKRFTKWYIKMGYTFGYDSYGDAYWNCPWYIKPLLFLFSPSCYCINENIGKAMLEGFLEGFKMVVNQE